MSTILGILSEMEMGEYRLEVGFMLRQAILVSSMLFSAEAWSGITEKQLARMEVVDSALLRRLFNIPHTHVPSSYSSER